MYLKTLSKTLQPYMPPSLPQASWEYSWKQTPIDKELMEPEPEPIEPFTPSLL
jgi:hypothetical protein